jgi:hypothetical protein
MADCATPTTNQPELPGDANHASPNLRETGATLTRRQRSNPKRLTWYLRLDRCPYETGAVVDALDVATGRELLGVKRQTYGIELEGPIVGDTVIVRRSTRI